MLIAPGVEPRDDLGAGARIGKVLRADLHGDGARHHELDGVLRAGDAAHADDGDGDGMRRLVDHAHGNGLDARARDAARVVGENGTAAFDIDRHAREGVDERETVRAAPCRCLRVRRDALHIGREFDDEGRIGTLRLGARRDLLDRLGTDAERHAAALDVGAGDVEFQKIHEPVEARAHALVILRGAPHHVGDDARLFFEPREILRDELFHAGVLQPHRVEDDAAALGDARHGIARPRHERDALRRHPAEAGNIVYFVEFTPEPERAGCSDDGIFQRFPAQRYRKISHCFLLEFLLPASFRRARTAVGFDDIVEARKQLPDVFDVVTGERCSVLEVKEKPAPRIDGVPHAGAAVIDARDIGDRDAPAAEEKGLPLQREHGFGHAEIAHDDEHRPQRERPADGDGDPPHDAALSLRNHESDAHRRQDQPDDERDDVQRNNARSAFCDDLLFHYSSLAAYSYLSARRRSCTRSTSAT